MFLIEGQDSYKRQHKCKLKKKKKEGKILCNYNEENSDILYCFIFFLMALVHPCIQETGQGQQTLQAQPNHQ